MLASADKASVFVDAYHDTFSIERERESGLFYFNCLLYVMWL